MFPKEFPNIASFYPICFGKCCPQVGQREGTLYFKIEPSIWGSLHSFFSFFFFSDGPIKLAHCKPTYVGGLSLSKLISLSLSLPPPISQESTFHKQKKKNKRTKLFWVGIETSYTPPPPPPLSLSLSLPFWDAKDKNIAHGEDVFLLCMWLHNI